MKKLIPVMTVLLFCAVALAQQETGQITGVVTDPTGAVVAAAQVTVTSVERQTVRTTTTTGAGFYSVTHLLPGTYKVSINHPGFAIASKIFPVTVGSTVSGDMALKVGAAGETVEVSGMAGVQVNTETQTLQQVITAQQVTEMPSLSRDPYALVATSGYASPDPEGRGTGYSINGQRAASTSILLDGTENVHMFYATVGQTIPMDSVQEFSLLTNNFTAEFGRASGGVVNVATKSGTNSLHGSAYEFNRNSAIASNSYENVERMKDAIRRNKCLSEDDRNCPGRKGVFTRNQFGFSVGGPVKKDKLFFFNNTEWLRVRSAGPRERWVLSDAFIAALPANAKAFMAIGKLKPNMIQTSTLLAKDLQKEINATGAFKTWADANPNTPVFQGVNWTVAQNQGGGSPQNSLYEVARVDYSLSNRTNLYGRFALQKEDFFPSSGLSPYEGYDYAPKNYNQNWLLSVTHSFTSNLASQSKVTFNRLNQQSPLGENPAGPTIYMNPDSVPTMGGKVLDFPGYLPEGPGTGIPAGGPQNVYEFNEDVTWTRGKHQFRFGGQYVHMRDNRMFGAYMNAVEDLSSGSNGDAFDNLMNGVLYDFRAAVYPQGKYPCAKTYNSTTGAVSVAKVPACQVTLPLEFPNFVRNNRYNDMAFYAQDSWKLTPRFTLNLGLRWEYYGVQHNADPKLDSNFYLGTGNTYFEQVRNGAVMLTGDSPVKGLWAPYKRGFGPRVGFAWDVFGDGRTALRGGYSISYERNFGNVTYNVIQNPPNYAVVYLSPSDVGGTIPITTAQVGPMSGTGSTYLTVPVSLRNPKQNIKSAYAATWSLSLDREVMHNTLASVSYSGSRGVHLYSITDMNRVGFGQLYLGDKLAPGCTSISVCGNRLNLQYAGGNQRGDDGFSTYNGLNLGLRTTNFKDTGVTLTANYTFAHAIDNISSTFSGGTNSQLGLLDPFNPALDKGNAEFDVRHRLTVSAIWNLPFFDKSNNRILKHALGGWELIPSLTARSGEPFSILDCRAALNVCPRYMPVSGPIKGGSNINGSTSSDPVPLFNPADGSNINRFVWITLPMTGTRTTGVGAYGNPALGGISSTRPNGFSDFPICSGLNYTGCQWPAYMTGRDAFRGPKSWGTDLGLFKNVKVTERFGLQIRGEMFNVLNHKNYVLNSGSLKADSNSGQVKVQKSGSRAVQLGARFLF